GIPGDHVGWYLLPFAAGNFLGPVVLGRLFDTIGRRPMIAATYAVSGLLLAVAGYLFALGILSATAQTIAWMVIFFFASAAASSAYLTVSETFPSRCARSRSHSSMPSAPASAAWQDRGSSGRSSTPARAGAVFAGVCLAPCLFSPPGLSRAP